MTHLPPPPAAGAGKDGLPPAPKPGILAEDYVAVLIVGLANRLNWGASSYYRRVWNTGIAEWRILLALGKKSSLTVAEVAEAADIDNAAASRGLKTPKQRHLVHIEQTNRRSCPRSRPCCAGCSNRFPV